MTNKQNGILAHPSDQCPKFNFFVLHPLLVSNKKVLPSIECNNDVELIYEKDYKYYSNESLEAG